MKTNVGRCSIPAITITWPVRGALPARQRGWRGTDAAEKLPIGKGIVKRRGEKLAILTLVR